MRPLLVAALVALSFPSAVFAEVPRVATDISPIQGLVARVMDGLGAPDQIVPVTGTVHNYDLRPSEAQTLSSADIVFWVGPSLTPWLERPIETLASDATIVSLLQAGDAHLLPFREDHHDEAHDHGHDDDHDHDDHAHGDDDKDPHAWLDPDNAALWLDVIAATLAEADPKNAVLYRENAVQGREEIAVAAASIVTRFAETDDLRYLMYHDATQYFEAHFGLTPIGAVTDGDAAAPGPAHIAELQEEISATGTDCLLVEPQENAALVDAFAADANMRIVRIDPLGSGLPIDRDFYPNLLNALADSFESCRR